jgi:hypothetical protein
MVALYARDLSKPHADFTAAATAFGVAACALLATWQAWGRFKKLRQGDQASRTALGPADTGDTATGSPEI